MSLMLSVFIGISLLIVAIASAIRIFTKPIVDAPIKIAETAADFGKHAIDRATDAFIAIFQAKIKIVSSTTVCDATPIAELAILKRYIHEIIDYSETSLGSKKRIVAEQTFVAKIGFDLADRFSASLDPSNRVMTIDLLNQKDYHLKLPVQRQNIIWTSLVGLIGLKQKITKRFFSS